MLCVITSLNLKITGFYSTSIWEEYDEFSYISKFTAEKHIFDRYVWVTFFWLSYFNVCGLRSSHYIYKTVIFEISAQNITGTWVPYIYTIFNQQRNFENLRVTLLKTVLLYLQIDYDYLGGQYII